MSIFVSIQHTLLAEPSFTIELDFDHCKNTPHLFAEILSQKSRVRPVHETIALKGSKLACRGHKLN